MQREGAPVQAGARGHAMRCQTADTLRSDWYWAQSVELKAYFLRVLTLHMRGCDKCKQRMSLFAEAAKSAEMPEMPDDIG